jgi:hypothetical protein
MRHPRQSAARLFGAIALLAITCLSASLDAYAQRGARLYDVTVDATDLTAAFEEAMRIAVVRATGKRDAANDAALAGLVSQARRYVSTFKPAAGGGTLVTFDGAAIERAIVAAGRSVWPRERPLTLVVLQGGGAESGKALTETAQLRGLPVTIANGAAASAATGREQALAAAQRAGADAVLVGDGSGVANGGPWRWSLYSQTASENWAGSLDDGVHGATDALARAAEAVLALPEIESRIDVAGVATLKDFATVSSALAEIAGVRRLAVIEAGPSGVTYSVVARGGADMLLSALGSDSRFERLDAGNSGAVGFRYRP